MVTGKGSLLSAKRTSQRLRRTLKIRTLYGLNAIADSIEVSHSVPLAAEHRHWVGRLPGGGPDIFSGAYLATWAQSCERLETAVGAVRLA
jgi:hypothetical protein